jgi:peptidoglycan/LPS O-acetylase OafA/YrhL
MRQGSLSATHIPGLDGLRGMAILLVLILHFGLMTPDTPFQRVVFGGISAGWIGVDLFFVLSGALITGILLDSSGERRYFANFYVRRVLRIFPLYFLILILSFYVLPNLPFPAIAQFSSTEGIAGKQIYYWLFLSNFSIAAQHGIRHRVMDISWSLAIEEQFYLLWPLVVYLSGIRRLPIICAFLILFSLGVRLTMQSLNFDANAIYMVTPARLDGLCAGALIAVALRWPGMTRNWLSRLAFALCSVGALATGCVAGFSGGLPWDGRLVQAIGFTTLACFFSGAVLWAVITYRSGSLFERVLGSRFFVAFGVLSYGMYLTHLPLRAILRDAIMRPSSFANWPGGTLVGQLVFYVMGGVLVYVVAWISFHGFERPLLRLKPKPETARPGARAPLPQGGA